MKLNLKKKLLADEAASSQTLTLYIPSRDRVGQPINSANWVRNAELLLNEIGGGSTQFSTTGSWLDHRTGNQVSEQVTLIYTYVEASKLKKKLPELRRFLHQLGLTTNQGEVIAEFDDRLYKIRFPKPKAQT